MQYKFWPDEQLFFLLPKIVSPVEMQMIKALQNDPEDVMTRNQYADFLLDQGYPPEAAEKIRMTAFVPGGTVVYWGEGKPMPGAVYSGAFHQIPKSV